MDSCKNPAISILCFLLILQYSVNSLSVDNQKLVYSRCSNQTSPNPSHFPLLSNLFQEFITQSSKSRFFQTIVADEKTAISGTFQCRNNLSPDECRSCVSKFPVISKDLCGKNSQARIQLSGCCAHYQEENGAELETYSRPDQLLHRACSKHKIKRSGFEEMKLGAFAALESGVTSGNGFCETTFESIHVVAQCAGSLGHCDCGECVNSAVQIAGEDECRYSVSGEIYLDSCFISYDYYRDGGVGTYTVEGNNSTKLVAIVAGGLAVAALGIGLCYFMRSCGKKEDDW